MDFDLLKKDGVALVQKLPRAFVQDAARVLTQHDLRALVPQLSTMWPHVQVILFEAAMPGGIDEAEMDKALREIFASVGVTLPELPKSG